MPVDPVTEFQSITVVLHNPEERDRAHGNWLKLIQICIQINDIVAHGNWLRLTQAQTLRQAAQSRMQIQRRISVAHGNWLKLIHAQTLKQDAQRQMQISGLRIQRRINVYETSTLRKGACAQQQKPQERMAGSQKQVKELTKTMPKQGDGQQGRTARSQGDEEHHGMTLKKMALEEQLGELKQAFHAQQIQQLRSKHHAIWQAQQLEELKQQQQRQAPMMSGSSNDVRQQRCLAATTSGSSSDGRQQLDYLLHHPPQAQHGVVLRRDEQTPYLGPPTPPGESASTGALPLPVASNRHRLRRIAGRLEILAGRSVDADIEWVPGSDDCLANLEALTAEIDTARPPQPTRTPPTLSESPRPLPPRPQPHSDWKGSWQSSCGYHWMEIPCTIIGHGLFECLASSFKECFGPEWQWQFQDLGIPLKGKASPGTWQDRLCCRGIDKGLMMGCSLEKPHSEDVIRRSSEGWAYGRVFVHGGKLGMLVSAVFPVLIESTRMFIVTSR